MKRLKHPVLKVWLDLADRMMHQLFILQNLNLHSLKKK